LAKRLKTKRITHDVEPFVFVSSLFDNSIFTMPLIFVVSVLTHPGWVLLIR